MSYKLFLDDIRNPLDNGWEIVRSYEEFLTIIQERGKPRSISFDHDLGEGGTGLDCVKWLIHDMRMDLRDVTITFHSENLVGVRNMWGLILGWRNFCERRDEGERQ